ncbi:GLMP [Branchiostoma lanceolatum]|uniref:GLMP protein n=1 Tax=Branchiostoma lanceolatum TaxID=7740 RepID=A0A8J9ZJ88_BRALA|nr:GLMP [Branchiostoma lanceolatum]
MAASRQARGVYECWPMFSLALFVFISLVVGNETFSRQVSMHYNPGCNITECQSFPPSNNNDTHNNLVHVLARGHRDSLHYVWSTIGAPTVLVVHTTSKDSELRVDWERLLRATNRSISGAITFEPSNAVDFSMAVIFNKIWEYEDLHDKSELPEDDAEMFEPYDLAKMRWDDFNMTMNATGLTGNFTGATTQQDMESLFQNGSISFKIHAFKTDDRSTDLPHLQYTSNQTQFDFTIDSVEPRGNMSRYAMEVMLITEDKRGTHVDLKKLQSIDDEYTPGVFELFELTTTHGAQTDSYVQWKPVCYTKHTRSMAVATPAKTHKLKEPDTASIPGDTIARAYFTNLDRLQRKALNVSFGLTGDGTYVASNFTSWTGDPRGHHHVWRGVHLLQAEGRRKGREGNEGRVYQGKRK